MCSGSGEITALAADGYLRYRARYGFFDESIDGGLRIDKYSIVGWAACDGEVFPLRMGDDGRGVLVGSPDDPDRDALLVVGQPGDEWEDLPGMDSRIRGIIREGIGEEVEARG
jgi:hypothetical protein